MLHKSWKYCFFRCRNPTNVKWWGVPRGTRTQVLWENMWKVTALKNNCSTGGQKTWPTSPSEAIAPPAATQTGYPLPPNRPLLLPNSRAWKLPPMGRILPFQLARLRNSITIRAVGGAYSWWTIQLRRGSTCIHNTHSSAQEMLKVRDWNVKTLYGNNIVWSFFYLLPLWALNEALVIW